MRIVERHEPYPTAKEQARQQYSSMVSDKLVSIRNAKNKFPGHKLYLTAQDYWRNIGRSSMYGTPTYVYNYLFYTNQLVRAWFTYTMNDGKPVTVHIADRQIETIGKFSQSGIDIDQLLVGILTASVLRDTEALKFYATIPLEFTEQADGMQDILTEIMFFFHQMLIEGSAKPVEAAHAHKELEGLLNWEEYRKYIDKNFSEADFRFMFKYRSWTVSYKFLPVLRIYYAVLSNHQEKYEQYVHDALLKWKEYYQINFTDERGQHLDYSTEPEGFIAIPILAACAYAYDRGMSLQTVSSEYIPEWLIKGDFTGLELLVKD
ncbi:Imm49 family immunity protein [Cytophagaceae bacterium YF14B1]|uniref:Imm49 family immunity protein n=1 Tax=Xanthocytophaga flava TaxID=3048013 RepID=A0AAE3R0T5_9BACT|nr:Imm49 family immunity protein [Xanthocytophaga flavus]MDJ1486023.1 Imm49 family immunity protein [Xanthocytophaga flavus]